MEMKRVSAGELRAIDAINDLTLHAGEARSLDKARAFVRIAKQLECLAHHLTNTATDRADALCDPRR